VEHSVGNATSFAIEFVELAAAGLVGVAVYVAWAWVFRLPELKAAIALARTLVGRRGSGGAPAIEPED
jgi:hypothetical protein